ncbi:18244_t:CDS:1 [Acaulospora morrowiae]|uniref:Trimethylguanosine synthase n=1 Tax=Acaulospora morrowiae TaxID=94023 RepID=A0A9N8W0E5_9GLOM|nr:18244_t:CDS:1 [Acaulospora morrowiae]
MSLPTGRIWNTKKRKRGEALEVSLTEDDQKLRQLSKNKRTRALQYDFESSNLGIRQTRFDASVFDELEEFSLTNKKLERKGVQGGALVNSYAQKKVLEYTEGNIPGSLRKYWRQRFDLFSHYDEGILMDEEGWYSVTPEAVAAQIAERCRCDIIVDAFCGVGGNAIQFANTCRRVIAIDIDETKLICARNNAKIYGVYDRIDFILGDYFKLIPKLKADVVFLSPPWGGPSYISKKNFDLKTMMVLDGEKLYHETTKITNNIAYYVPRNVDPQQLADFAGRGNTCEVQQIYVEGKFKTQVAYYGELKCKEN